MKKKDKKLPKEVQDYLNDRYLNPWTISPAVGFDKVIRDRIGTCTDANHQAAFGGKCPCTNKPS